MLGLDINIQEHEFQLLGSIERPKSTNFNSWARYKHSRAQILALGLNLKIQEHEFQILDSIPQTYKFFLDGTDAKRFFSFGFVYSCAALAGNVDELRIERLRREIYSEMGFG